MQRIIFPLFLVATLVFIGCKTDNTLGEVNLKVTATYDDVPLVNLDETYAYPDGTPVKFQLVNYYLSDIQLIKESQPEGSHLLSGVELFQYDDFYTQESAKEGINLSFKEVPDGVYNGIRMGIGLAPDLNATQPGDYAAGHVLTNNYWSWALGYVFAKIEGTADLDGDGEFTDKMTYHVGKDDLYKVIEINSPIVVEKGEITTIPLNVDVLDVLKDADNQYIDISISGNIQDHTNDENIFGFLFANLTNAVKLVE